jgi:hypothetical protein
MRVRLFPRRNRIEDFSIESDIQAYFATVPTADIEALKAEIKQLKTLVNNQQKSQEKTSMSHIIAIAALTATAEFSPLPFHLLELLLDSLCLAQDL